MAHTYYAVYEHICFSTKNRVDALQGEFRAQAFQFLGGSVKSQGCILLIVGGMGDHVHLLVRKKSTLPTPDLVKEIKRTSSTWLSDKGVPEGRFHWQIGYGAFSISYWDVEKIRKYIDNQEQHHQKVDWATEYRKLLIKHGVEFDEQYYLD